MKGYWILSFPFYFISWDDCVLSSPFIVLMWFIALIDFLCVELFSYPKDKSYLVMVYDPFIWIQFASVFFLRNVASLFFRGIGL